MIAVYVFGGILAVLIVAVLVGSVMEREAPDERVADMGPEERKEAAIEGLREIEFDYKTGKLLKDDYEALRSRYAALALGARDAIASQPDAHGGRCHACAATIESGSRFCPQCGAEQPLPAGKDAPNPPAEAEAPEDSA